MKVVNLTGLIVYTLNNQNLPCVNLSFNIADHPHYITVHYALCIINIESVSDLHVKAMPWTRSREVCGTLVTHIITHCHLCPQYFPTLLETSV